MQTRFVNWIHSAQTMIPVHRLQHGSKQSSNFKRHKNKSTQNYYYCGTPNWTREHSKVCKAKISMCGKCGKKGHLDSLCRSSGTPMHMVDVQDGKPPQSREATQDYNQSPETAQYSTLYFIPEMNYHRQNATVSRLYKSWDLVWMSRVNISS